MAAKRVLIIDDEENMRHLLKAMLEKDGYVIAEAMDGVEGLQHLERSSFDFVLCDIKMPRMDGMAFLKLARKSHPDKTYVMMSAYGTVETALEAMKDTA